MTAAAWPWLQFALLAALIGIGGYRLTCEADAIAELLALSRTWVGVALVATVTSLPELATGITAVTAARAPDVAVGNALGACVVNLAFLAVVDLLVRGNPLYRQASQSHILAAGFGAMLLGVVVVAVLLGQAAQRTGGTAGLLQALPLGIGPATPLLLGLYLVAVRTIFRHESEGTAADRAAPPARLDARQRARLRAHAGRFAFAALVVLLAAMRLPFVATEIAQAMGWSGSLVGTVFVAAVTTLPEMAVTLSAVRIGALDLAIGNLLGSNLFNVAIVAIDDLFYPGASLLAEVSAVHATTAAVAVVMTGLAVVGLYYRPQRRLLRTVGWVSIGLVAMYVLNAIALALYAG
ncbi:sodium:calcium antiporter [Azohydromonas sediminis]|uniref:sodium:calcium antiporter n=1 Tax=Azohydromonas sediminis TaxID=2259674 RepID=UPI000E64B345|nr:sodium:calcium antiporter [Azohydromonas sediminis]